MFTDDELSSPTAVARAGSGRLQDGALADLPRNGISRRFSGGETELYAKTTPAKEVGGDFFDFFFVDSAEKKLCLVIADVSGKGESAAQFMLRAKKLIRERMLKRSDPALALKSANKALIKDNPNNMFVTVFIAVLNFKTGRMVYANGGHNPPLLSSSGDPYKFLPLKSGIPPGAMSGSIYSKSIIYLNDGDKIYLYTDGINEAMNKNREMFGNDAFIKAANEFRGLPPKEFDKAIREEIATFVAEAEQFDDITTLSLAFHKKRIHKKPRIAQI